MSVYGNTYGDVYGDVYGGNAVVDQPTEAVSVALPGGVYGVVYGGVYGNVYGVGVTPITDVEDIDCDLAPVLLCASNGQSKTQRFQPTLDGRPIDLTGRDLTFVIEDNRGNDLETGTAFQNSAEDEEDPFEVSFTASAANAVAGKYRWAVRDDATQSVIGHGEYCVQYFATSDAIALSPNSIDPAQLLVLAGLLAGLETGIANTIKNGEAFQATGPRGALTVTYVRTSTLLNQSAELVEPIDGDDINTVVAEVISRLSTLQTEVDKIIKDGEGFTAVGPNGSDQATYIRN